MFTIETKINNILINHLYCHNLGALDSEKPDICYYKYQYYNIQKCKLIKGFVCHNTKKGMLVLQKIIIEDILKNEKT